MSDESPIAEVLKPQTFEELLAVTEATKGCSRCPKPATHKITLSATKMNVRKEGDGRRSGPPSGIQVAKHGGYLCESCAVGVYSKFREIIR